MAAIRWESIHKTITAEYERMNNGEHMNGWDASAITDCVCYALRDIGVNILDIPTHCMEADPRLLPNYPKGF